MMKTVPNRRAGSPATGSIRPALKSAAVRSRRINAYDVSASGDVAGEAVEVRYGGLDAGSLSQLRVEDERGHRQRRCAGLQPAVRPPCCSCTRAGASAGSMPPPISSNTSAATGPVSKPRVRRH